MDSPVHRRAGFLKRKTMKKGDILRLKRIETKVNNLESKLSLALQEAALVVEEISGVNGQCSWLPGDGLGFSCSGEDFIPVFVPFSDLIQMCEDGIELSEDFINSTASL